MWDLNSPRTRIKPVSPALAGRFLTTGQRSPKLLSKQPLNSSSSFQIFHPAYKFFPDSEGGVPPKWGGGHKTEDRGSRKQISGREVGAGGRCGGWIPRITSEVLHQVTEVKAMARRCKGDGGMLTRKETKPGQTGATQTSRQIPLRTGDKTGTIWASDEFE